MKGRTYHCRYCSTSMFALDIYHSHGRCSCGGQRRFNSDTENIECERCQKVSERLTAKYRDERALDASAATEIANHETAIHATRLMIDRFTEIEREAKRALESDPNCDWATHPLAVEYRALMKAWWAIPDVTLSEQRHSPSYNRAMTAKGTANTIENTHGIDRERKKLLARATETGERRFSVGGCEYRLWFDEADERRSA